MDWRKNQGFIIVNQITVGGAEFVLGVHEKNPNSFVTWQLCPPSKNRHKKASKNEMNRSISLIC